MEILSNGVTGGLTEQVAHSKSQSAQKQAGSMGPPVAISRSAMHDWTELAKNVYDELGLPRSSVPFSEYNAPTLAIIKTALEKAENVGREQQAEFTAIDYEE